MLTIEVHQFFFWGGVPPTQELKTDLFQKLISGESNKTATGCETPWPRCATRITQKRNDRFFPTIPKTDFWREK